MGPVPADARTAEAWRSFGVRLRQWRRRAGLTQAQVGARVGYDHTAISKLEHGSRRTPPPLAGRLDDLLGAGGDLLAACEDAGAQERAGGARTPARRGPLPGEPAGGELLAMLPPGTVLPVSLPAYGLVCPVHGRDGCTVPVLTDVIALHAAFCALDPDTSPRPALDHDTVHALTALLAVCLRADEERAWPGATAVVERTLHAMLRWMALPAASYQRRLAPLAAEYAQSAGCLRLLWGRNGTAMAWLDRSLVWAAMAGHVGTEVAALSDMSTLARLEGDGPSALAYGEEIRRAAAGRHWAGAMSDLYQARGHAVRGDAARTLGHIDRAWSQMDRVGERDETEAPWLSVASVRLRVESGAAGALRDLAAATGDRRYALRAVGAAGTALGLLPPGMHSARMLFLARLADAHACAGDPAAAQAVAGPVLDTTEVNPATLLGQELRGLHTRLAGRTDRTARRPETDDFVRRLAAVVR
ncbi:MULTISPECIES: helix-turn-helix transcriptional regulator [unclassified Streptomyces]|uniref:helix-turn-helix domain-containing protein n=1 Tax=unclassified Streptomyces TaxID=2593676 RepID=UPI00224D67D4|nr:MULTISPECIES: helix-turn-helix transcriptional regulator [unclassified Streptomyces]MCX5138561.1 helix-turn-helix transcriptional regulator [Streptomyces sp. NBC_00338]WRZ63236.1 helix-turn-helix transcriptional regulator [Streptomyces sp. NBC_01257]